MKSIIQTNNNCFFCGKYNTQTHHIRLGNCTRKKAEQFGLLVKLCPECHNQVHTEVKKGCVSKKTILQAYAQKELEKYVCHDVYMNLFGKNYL